jgi:hypothetical protein
MPLNAVYTSAGKTRPKNCLCARFSLLLSHTCLPLTFSFDAASDPLTYAILTLSATGIWKLRLSNFIYVIIVSDPLTHACLCSSPYAQLPLLSSRTLASADPISARLSTALHMRFFGPFMCYIRLSICPISAMYLFGRPNRLTLFRKFIWVIKVFRGFRVLRVIRLISIFRVIKVIRVFRVFRLYQLLS